MLSTRCLRRKHGAYQNLGVLNLQPEAVRLAAAALSAQRGRGVLVGIQHQPVCPVADGVGVDLVALWVRKAMDWAQDR